MPKILLRGTLPELTEPLFNVRIQGRPAIKKNNYRIFRRGRGSFIAPSVKYKDWENDLVGRLLLRGKERLPIDFPVYMQATFHFKNHQHECDTSNCLEGIQDVLAKADIIKNDKLIYRILSEKVFDGEEFIEIFIYKL